MQVGTYVRACGCPGGPDLHLHRGAAFSQAGEALGHDPGDGACCGHTGRVTVLERVHQPGPSDCAEHWVVGQLRVEYGAGEGDCAPCLLYTSPSPRDRTRSRMPSSA